MERRVGVDWKGEQETGNRPGSQGQCISQDKFDNGLLLVFGIVPESRI